HLQPSTPSRLALDAPDLSSRGGEPMAGCGRGCVIARPASGWFCATQVNLTMPCKDIDERVHAFLDRPLTGEWPYLWLDATCLKQRESGRIVSVAAIISVAVNTDGRREIVRLHIGPSEAPTFRWSFLKRSPRRGTRGTN